MCWTGLEIDMQCKMGLISRAYWFPLRCSWIWLLAIIPEQQTMMNGWMDIILCLTLMFHYHHQRNRWFDLIWWASWDCWGSKRGRKSCTGTFLYNHHHDWGTPEQGHNLQCLLHLYSHSCRGVNVQNCSLKIKEHFYKFQLVKYPMLRQRQLKEIFIIVSTYYSLFRANSPYLQRLKAVFVSMCRCVCVCGP